MPIYNTSNRYGLVAIFLHWLVALTIICLFAVGLWMSELPASHPWAQKAPFIHKSIGILLFVAMLARLIWRLCNTVPEHLPTHGPILQRLERSAHHTLYLLVFITLFSGYMMASARGLPISVFDWFSIPPLITGIPNQGYIARNIHQITAWCVIVLASGHALMAIKHHFIDKDRTLKRMLGG